MQAAVVSAAQAAVVQSVLARLAFPVVAAFVPAAASALAAFVMTAVFLPAVAFLMVVALPAVSPAVAQQPEPVAVPESAV